jgi:hypothetical protein
MGTGHMKFKESEKKTIGAVGSFVYISGATLFILDHWVRVTTEVGTQHHPLEHWVRAVHSLLTYLAILSIGYLIKAHILPGLRAKPRINFKTGVIVLTAFSIMLVSALVILYGGEGEVQEFLTQVHAYLGLSIPLVILIHVYRKLKSPEKKLEFKGRV